MFVVKHINLFFELKRYIRWLLLAPDTVARVTHKLAHTHTQIHLHWSDASIAVEVGVCSSRCKNRRKSVAMCAHHAIEQMHIDEHRERRRHIAFGSIFLCFRFEHHKFTVFFLIFDFCFANSSLFALFVCLFVFHLSFFFFGWFVNRWISFLIVYFNILYIFMWNVCEETGWTMRWKRKRHEKFEKLALSRSVHRTWTVQLIAQSKSGSFVRIRFRSIAYSLLFHSKHYYFLFDVEHTLFIRPNNSY